MISVQNLLRQLSGNKIYIASLLLVFVLASCSGTKKTTRPTTRKQTKTKPTLGGIAKGNTQKATGKVDTIRWKEIDKSRDYSQTIEDLDLEKRPRYEVSMFLPFNLDEDSMLESNNENSRLGRMTHYYAGVKIALEQLENEGIGLDVNVYDSEDGDFGRKLKECIQSDVIIGPWDKDQIANAASFGRNNQIPVISPWRTNSKIAKDNPYYVQIVPGQKAHYDRIVTDLKSEFSDDQVILLGRDNPLDKKYMTYMQQVGASINKNRKKPFREFYLEMDSLMIGETAFDSIFYEDKTTVFVLPHFSSEKDEDFIYNTVRKMNGERGLNKVVLYGMPILLESQYVRYEHYRSLNMRICKSSYVDRTSPEVKNFRKQYFEIYNDFPSNEAFEGFDLMLFVGRQMFNYGKKFQYFMEDYEASLLQTKFDVQKVFDKDDSFNNIQYFQNQHLYILKFDRDKFVAQ